jgi:hypothetical protein
MRDVDFNNLLSFWWFLSAFEYKVSCFTKRTSLFPSPIYYYRSYISLAVNLYFNLQQNLNDRFSQGLFVILFINSIQLDNDKIKQDKPEF